MMNITIFSSNYTDNSGADSNEEDEEEDEDGDERDKKRRSGRSSKEGNFTILSVTTLAATVNALVVILEKVISMTAAISHHFLLTSPEIVTSTCLNLISNFTCLFITSFLTFLTAFFFHYFPSY